MDRWVPNRYMAVPWMVSRTGTFGDVTAPALPRHSATCCELRLGHQIERQSRLERRRQFQSSVGGQDVDVQLAQRVRRRHTMFFGQRRTQGLERPDGARPPARSVEREHQETDQSLVGRMAAHQSAQLSDQLVVQAKPQVDADTFAYDIDAA